MLPTEPGQDSITVEMLLPHRGRMLLVGEILSLDDTHAATTSVACADWPFCENGVVDSLILVELVAQTAGVHNGLVRLKTRGRLEENRGWLVGIKKAFFYIATIPVGTTITTTAENTFAFENLREITGTAMIKDRVAAEVTLQVVEAE